MGPAWDRHWHSFWLPEELEAGFTMSHQREFPVMAHATNPEAVQTAVRLGAHSVEHGYIMDEDCLQMLLERETWYVPTLAISHLTPGQASSEAERRWVERRGMAQDLIQRADAASEEHREWFQRAIEVAGDGPRRREWEAAAERFTVAARFHGALRRREIESLRRRCDVLVVPSRVLPGGRTEGMPVTLLEALASARPVVAAAVGIVVCPSGLR